MMAKSIDPPEAVALPDVFERLTVRQIMLMELIVLGGNNTDIAQSLGLSPHTVKVHFYRLFKRLGVRSRGEATRLWRERQEVTERAEVESLRSANTVMLMALEWLAVNSAAPAESIEAVIGNAITAGKSVAK